MEFTIESAISYSRNNLLKDWILAYLQDHGNNIKLAKFIDQKGGYFIGPIEFSLMKLIRCTGPEKNMLFKQDKEKWEKSILNLISFIKNGHKYPPLIVWFKNGIFSVADGNHRYEAFIRLNYKKYPTIFWFEKEKDYNNFLNKLN